MASVSERAVDHIETMHGGEILASIDQIDKRTRLLGVPTGLDEETSNAGPLSLNVPCGYAAVTVSDNPPESTT